MDREEDIKIISIELLHKAIENHDSDELYRILQTSDLEIDQPLDKVTALGLAIENGNVLAVTLLLEAGANINTETYCLAYCTYERPIVTASRLKNKEIFNMLLTSGHTVDLSCDGHKDALQWAATHGDMNMVQDLLRLPGADVNWINTHGDTCLHYATMGGFQDIVQLLLEKGSEINENNEWRSPVHIASLHGYVNILKQLLQKQPQASNKDMYNNTPMSIAAWRNRCKAMGVLVPYLSKKLDAEEMQITLDHALGSAVRGRGLEACQFLLKHSANPNSVHNTGILCLNETYQMPVNTVGMSFFSMLIAAGARLDLEDHFGLIPFYRLLIGNGEYSKPFLFALIYHGADCCGQDLSVYFNKTSLNLLNFKTLVLPVDIIRKSGSRLHDKAFFTLTKYIRGTTDLARRHYGADANQIIEAQYCSPCQAIEDILASIPRLVCLARACVRQQALRAAGGASLVPHIEALPNIPPLIRQFLKLRDILEHHGFHEEGSFRTPTISLQ